jgi:DNA polymerase type B, organellar and viral
LLQKRQERELAALQLRQLEERAALNRLQHQGRQHVVQPNQIGFGAQNFTPENSSTVRNNFFNTEHTTVTIRLNDDVRENLFAVHGAIAEAIAQIRALEGQNDRVSVTVISSGGSAICTGFFKRKDLRFDLICSEIYNVSQSNENFLLTDKILLKVSTVKDLHGKGSDQARKNMRQAGKKTSQIGIKAPSRHIMLPNRINNENICLLAAVVIGQKWWTHKLNRKSRDAINEYKQAKRQNSPTFARWVHDLQAQAHLDLAAGAGVQEIMELDRALGEHFKLKVFSGRSVRDLIFGGGADKHVAAKTITLLHERDHFTFLSSTAAFLRCKFFCDTCNRGYNNRIQHSCFNRNCTSCKTQCSARNGQTSRHECVNCNLVFLSDDCYRNHLATVCDIRKCCADCGTLYWLNVQKNYTHQCNELYCRVCKKYMPQDHLCYMKKSMRSPQAERQEAWVMYSFCDFESTTEDAETAPGLRRHAVNLVWSITVCRFCEEERASADYHCMYCRGRTNSIDAILEPETNVVKEFLSWADEKAAPIYGRGGEVVPEREHHITFFNLKNYDGLFILRHVLCDSDWLIKSHIIDGRKVLKLVIENKMSGRRLHFFDFCAFVNTSLSSLCSAFGLDANLAKGFFPHSFNKAENYEWSGCQLPDIGYWDVDNQTESTRNAIIRWHAQENATMRRTKRRLDFYTWINSYCKNDCVILWLAALAFKDFFVEQNVSPFTESVTIASLTQLLFRRNFMPENTICMIKSTSKGAQSKLGLMWLQYMEEREGAPIQHSASAQGEKFLHGRFVDGYREDQNGTKYVYEVQFF